MTYRAQFIVLALSLASFLPSVRGQGPTEAFTLSGQSVSLTEITDQVALYYRSMRYDRAAQAWHVEVVVSNTSGAVEGPCVLWLDEFENLTGWVGADGVLNDRPYMEIGGTLPGGELPAGASSIPHTLTLGAVGTAAPVMDIRVFARLPGAPVAAAVVRTLTPSGQPLSGVTVEETGPIETRTFSTDAGYGVATLGQGAGVHEWLFSRPGHLSVWRQAVLEADGGVPELASPRLVPRSTHQLEISPLEAGELEVGSLSLTFPQGAVDSIRTAVLTPLGPQTLPALLPRGWSPLQAFWLEFPGALLTPAVAEMTLWGKLLPGETAALVRWDATGRSWRVSRLVPGTSPLPFALNLDQAGVYAVVVSDLGSLAPPPPQLDQALPGAAVDVLDVGALTAGGMVDPESRPASLDPARVTATAKVRITHPTANLSSGLLLPCEVHETYDLKGGVRLNPPPYDQFVSAFQRPGPTSGSPLPVNELASAFPLRPLYLFGRNELVDALIQVDVLAPGGFTGTLVPAAGGQIGGGSLRLLAGGGVFDRPQATRFRPLDPSDFQDWAGELELLAAFDLTVSGLRPDKELALRWDDAPPDALLVVARVFEKQGWIGFEPVLRLASDAQGNLTSLETDPVDRLPGIAGAGQYVVVRVDVPQKLVLGIARDAGGNPAGGLLAQLGPWSTCSQHPDGRFRLIAPEGEHTLRLTDLDSLDEASIQVTLASGQDLVRPDLGTVLAGPRVTSVSPEDGAERVPRVSPVVVTFDRPVNPASLLPEGVRLLDGSGDPVPASFSLNLANTAVTLLPANPLQPAALHTLSLSTTIADTAGQVIEGATEFTFTTVGLPTRDPAAQLIIYEPGATNVPVQVLADIPAYTPGEVLDAIVVRGTPGTADPEVPVILLNESSGETATVLSKPDGSFASLISGVEEDFVSATFVNLNGTRVYVPVSRQEFDDGFVGLYRQGGILEAESDGGPVRVIIEPESIQTKSKLRLTTLNLAELDTLLGGVRPSDTNFLFAADAIELEVEGERPAEGTIDVEFPVDLDAAGYPAELAAEDVAAALTVVRDTEGVKTFEILAPMEFIPNEAAPAPFSSGGLSLFSVDAACSEAGDQFRNGTMAAGMEAATGLLPGGDLAQAVFRFVLVPMILGGEPIIVKGKVGSLTPEEQLRFGTLQTAALITSFTDAGEFFQVALDAGQVALARPLPGAFITLSQGAVPQIGRAGRLRPGMVYATSDARGDYTLPAPSVSDAYIITATHPLFKDKDTQLILGTLDLNLAAGAFHRNFFFTEPRSAQFPPSVSISHRPLWPTAGQECTVQVTASSGAGKAPDIEIWIHSVEKVVAGDEVGLEDAELVGPPVEVVTGSRRQLSQVVRADKTARVMMRVVVFSEEGGAHPTIYHPIDFSGQPAVERDVIPPSLDDDEVGPYITTSFPPDRGFVDIDSGITVLFNEPVNRSAASNTVGIVVSGSTGVGDVAPYVTLSPDQQVATMRFAGLKPDTEYTLELNGQTFIDLSDNPLDQNPATEDVEESFVMTFRTAPIQTVDLSFGNARGTAIEGDHLYVLEAGEGFYLDTYRLPPLLNAAPERIARNRVVGFPRDLAVIPDYAYRLKAVGENGPAFTNDLVAVVGGDLASYIDDFDDSVRVPGQYLRVFEVGETDGETALRELASPIVSYRVGSAVTKVKWAPPYLLYHEFGAEFQSIGFVNLQSLLIGFQATTAEQEALPDRGREGVDKNRDGDYVDTYLETPGDAGSAITEVVPLPEGKPSEFYGKDFNVFLSGTTRKMRDFDFATGRLGAAMSGGFLRDGQGNVTATYLPPAYQTLPLPGEAFTAEEGTHPFEQGAQPRRVSLFALPVRVEGVVELLQVALVSLTPDADGVQKLAVIDITLPGAPRELNKIPFPDDLVGGQLQSVRQRADGGLELATSSHRLLLSPVDLAEKNIPEDQLHPAVIGYLPGAGSSTRSTGTTDYGLYVSANGSSGTLVLAPPVMNFVHFPQADEVVVPFQFVDREGEFDALLDGVRPVGEIVSSRFRNEGEATSDLFPANPLAHYHVLIDMPGQAGDRVEIGLESLNWAGRPLPNKGLGFAPVRAVSQNALDGMEQVLRPSCDAPIQPLVAWRMSSDPQSPYFNKYLTTPFALVYENVSLNELQQLRTQVPGRDILFGGSSLRAFLDPGERNNFVVGQFAARIDTDLKDIQPIASARANTLNVSYIPGENPPPAAGHFALAGTFGSVSAHNGEVRMDATDLSLPSPRMGIEIVRHIGGQDYYDGPFGPGWDLNYNQRLTELKVNLFPDGQQMPLITRSDTAESVVARTGDLLLNSGEGRIYVFHDQGEDLPPEFAQDPLVQDFDYASKVARYYLPENGVFDLMVKFFDGYYERLTPDGMRYRYNNSGRLEMIIDRYPANRHLLDYDRKGHLVRIRDKSVLDDRFVEIGYYRSERDPDFIDGLDEVAPNKFTEGRICRLRDYADRDVLYFYDDEGLLIRREGIEVDGENGGFAGRNQTHYTYEGCKIVGVAVTGDAVPLFNAKTQENENGAPVVQSTTGIGGPTQVTVPLDNTAEQLEGLVGASTQPDGRTTETTYDENGHPTSIKVSGGEGEDSETKPDWNEHGQPLITVSPEGRAETRVYDENNPVFRSRGNLLRLTVDAGPRGGPGYTETYSYDARYNLASGAHTDANGFTHTYTLSPDGRDITVVRHGADHEETFDHNDHGQLTSHRGYDGIEKGYTYDAATGFVRTLTQGGNTYTYTYGGGIPGLLGEPSSIQPPRGAGTTYAYDNNLRRVEAVRDALITRYAYDEQGRRIYQEEEFGDGKQRTVTKTINALGFVEQREIAGVEVHGVETTLVYTYTPDKLFRVKTVQHPGAALQEYEYDKRDAIIKTTVAGYVEEFTRDREGNTLEVRQGGELVHSFEYDGLNRSVRSIRYSGTSEYVTDRTYHPGGQPLGLTVTDPQFGVVKQETNPDIDALGRITRKEVDGTLVSPTYLTIHGPNSRSVTGPLQTTTLEWDAAGYSTRRVDAISTTTFQTDGNGNVERIQRQEDGATYTDSYTYNDLDHRDTITDQLGPVATLDTRADGFHLEITNARNHTTEMEHSALGEVLSRRRADGMTFHFRHDEQRETTFTGDGSEGISFSFDDLPRLTAQSLRNGSTITYGDFDPRNMPREVSPPGGRTTIGYDRLRRLKSLSSDFLGRTYQVQATHDALDRTRVQNYEQDGRGANIATYSYDVAGPMLEARFQELGGDYTVGYTHYDDLTRASVEYPSGMVVDEERDSAGRLLGISDPDGLIARIDAWQGTAEPRTMRLGAGMRCENQYDARGRLIASRVTRVTDGAVLAHMRYQYDAANNLEVRQFVHRAGKAESFGYDNGERVARGVFGAVPLDSGGASVPDYERTYGYEATGLDYLVSADLDGINAARAPPFARTWSAHDAFLSPTVVDGFTRGATDTLGRVQRAQLQTRHAGADVPLAVPANITHNGKGALVRIERDDGLILDNHFQPNGLRHARVVSGTGPTSNRQYVYDSTGRLLEEYETEGPNPGLVGRYYYLAEDSPIAADLRVGTNDLQRVYFLKDAAQSVVAVADEEGVVLERVWYDTYGQPAIEQRDEELPQVRRVLAGENGALLLEWSEPVFPQTDDPGIGTGIVRYSLQPPGFADALVVSTGAPPVSVSGTVEFLPELDGFAPNTVVRYLPDSTFTGSVQVVSGGGMVMDEWGLTNLTQTITFTNETENVAAGTVFFNSVADTAPASLARSGLDSPFLFHGQYFDYDAGLLYLRARFYDPFSGMFLAPDPLGYEDSVNLYAGFGNNPVVYRDPTGLSTRKLKSDLGRPYDPRVDPLWVNKRYAGDIGIVPMENPIDYIADQRRVALGVNNPRGTGMKSTLGSTEATAVRQRAVDFMDNKDSFLKKVDEAALEAADHRLPPHKRTRIIVNIEGMEGDSPAEALNAAIVRGQKGWADKGYEMVPDLHGVEIPDDRRLRMKDQELRLTHARDYKHTRKKLTYDGDDHDYSYTDIEMYILYRRGAFKNVSFVRGMEGDIPVPELKAMFRD